MAALPYMPLYVADYMADAAHLTTLQHGAYLLMLMNYWQRGKPLPTDEVQLARIARLGRKEWNANRAEILAFFYEEENLLKHGRVEAELAKVRAKSLKCRKAGLTSVQRRLNGRSTDDEQTLNHTDTDTSKKKVPLDKSNGADSDKIFWDTAKAFLSAESRNPGALIGKWCRDHGKSETAAALTRAQLERPVQIVPFVTGCLKKAKADEYSWNTLA
jgi:uncharacterized protein YdaU (DUF1376 family)